MSFLLTVLFLLLVGMFDSTEAAPIFIVSLALIATIALHFLIQKRNREIGSFGFTDKHYHVPPTREEFEAAGRRAMKSLRLGEVVKHRTPNHVMLKHVKNANQKMIDSGD